MRAVLDPSPLAAVPDSPPARRSQRARWRDPRVVCGVALVVISMLVGALALSGGAGESSVWRVTRDLPAGSALTPDDLEAVSAVLPSGTSFVSADSVPTGVLTRGLAAGELLPANATAPQQLRDVRLVTVPVDPVHAPVDLAAGSVVDVWSTVETALGEARPPLLVLAGTRVSAVAADADGVSGALAVVLEVPTEQTAALVAASRTGIIDLIAVPAVP